MLNNKILVLISRWYLERIYISVTVLFYIFHGILGLIIVGIVIYKTRKEYVPIILKYNRHKRKRKLIKMHVGIFHRNVRATWSKHHTRQTPAFFHFPLEQLIKQNFFICFFFFPFRQLSIMLQVLNIRPPIYRLNAQPLFFIWPPIQFAVLFLEGRRLNWQLWYFWNSM